MRFVKSDKPITTKHETHGDLSVDVEVPQVESTEEAIAFCGGQNGFLEYFNAAIETSAKNGGRATLRNLAKDANLDEGRAKVQEVVKNYQPQSSDGKGPSVKVKAATLDKVSELVNSGREFTKDELLALLAAAK
jgi:hypothetical protein